MRDIEKKEVLKTVGAVLFVMAALAAMTYVGQADASDDDYKYCSTPNGQSVVVVGKLQPCPTGHYENQ